MGCRPNGPPTATEPPSGSGASSTTSARGAGSSGTARSPSGPKRWIIHDSSAPPWRKWRGGMRLVVRGQCVCPVCGPVCVCGGSSGGQNSVLVMAATTLASTCTPAQRPGHRRRHVDGRAPLRDGQRPLPTGTDPDHRVARRPVRAPTAWSGACVPASSSLPAGRPVPKARPGGPAGRRRPAPARSTCTSGPSGARRRVPHRPRLHRGQGRSAAGTRILLDFPSSAPTESALARRCWPRAPPSSTTPPAQARDRRPRLLPQPHGRPDPQGRRPSRSRRRRAHAGRAPVVPDRIEAATYLAAVGVAGGEITAAGARPTT